MAELAVITKHLDFQLEQVQDFTPTPMTVSTETWYTGYDPYTLEPVKSAKSQQEKLAQRQYFFWYKPEERRGIEQSLRRIGKPELIKELFDKLPHHPTPTTHHPTPNTHHPSPKHGNNRANTRPQESPKEKRGRRGHHK